MRSKIPAAKRIVSAATTLFYKNGFEQTTFAQIAKNAGLSQPALYVYFNDKMNLLAAVCTSAAEAGRDLIDVNIDPHDSAEIRFKSYIHANLDFFHTQKELSHAIMAAYYFASSDAGMREVFTALEGTTKNRIKTAIVQCRRERQQSVSRDFTDDVDAAHSILVGDCYKAIYLERSAGMPALKLRSWKNIKAVALK